MRAWLARALLWLFSALPFRVAQAGGSALGWLHTLLPNRARRTSADNLARCFPELTAQEHRRRLHASLLEMGRTFAEAAWLWNRTGEQVMPLVRETRGHEHVEHARRTGRGIVFATPHLGAWELAGAAVAQELPLTVLFRPPRMAALGEFLRTARARLGTRPVPIDAGGIRALHRALQRGEAVGLLPDQRPQAGHGVEAPLFGHPVPTMTLVSRLAERHDAPVIMAAMERLPRGQGFRLHFWPADPAVGGRDPAAAAAALNREVERAIAIAPAQYMWNYRRFRRRR